jgi:2-oxoglutarate ferredoxin oxidoreductase subunit alpha
VFWPYQRDPETLARPWAVPGTPGLEHRIGGLEKEDGSGNISYEPANHEHMVELRAARIAGIAGDIAPVTVSGDVDDADLLVLGWGSTWGAIDGGVNRCRARGMKVAHGHLTHINPFPPDLGPLLARHRHIIVPEMNLGQLSRLVRAEFLVDARSVTKVRGAPFTAAEIEAAIAEKLSSADTISPLAPTGGLPS